MCSNTLNFKKHRIESSLIIVHYPRIKWIVLIVCCYAVFSNTYCNNLTSLQTPLLESFGLSNFQYNLLFSVYSLPNIVLPIMGGILIDKIHAETCLLLFIFLETVGQFLFSLGTYIFNYNLMIAGRIFYGLGGECVHVTTYTLIGIYFDASYVAFAMGIRQSMARFGSSSNDIITSTIYSNNKSISSTLWIGFIALILSLITAILLFFYIQHYNTKMDLYRQFKITQLTNSTSLLSQYSKSNTNISDDDTQFTQTKSSTVPINYGSTPSIFKPHSRSSFRLRDIQDFKSSYWLLNISCILMYGCTITWNNIASNELQTRFNLSYEYTNQLLMIFFIITGICCPIFGYIADKIGHKCHLIIFCGLLLFISHILLYSYNVTSYFLNPLIIITILGIAFSIFPAAIFPGIALIVRKKTYGTAYGLITACFNTALTIYPILIAMLTQTNYTNVELFFTILALLSIFVGVWLLHYDKKHGSKLTKVTHAIKVPKMTKLTSPIFSPPSRQLRHPIHTS